MNQKTKLSLLTALLVVTVAVVSYFLLYTFVLTCFAVKTTWGFGGRLLFWILRKPVGMCLIAVAVSIPVFWISWRRLKHSTVLYIVAGIPSALILLMGLLPLSTRRTNKLGLIANRPNSTHVQNYKREKNKDNYPTCTFRYNSLGFRDQEPELTATDTRRVLIIGDSFVWGDGIATNDQTVGTFLRKELTKKSAKYTVVSAGYPGLGIHGYYRYYQRLKTLIRPNIVVIGFLGNADYDPFDSQVLMDHIPKSFFFRNMFLNLSVAQRIHKVSVSYSKSLWSTSTSIKRVKEVLEKLVMHQKRDNIRIVFFNYFPKHHQSIVPPELESIHLPEHLSYPGRRNEFWYAKDNHPKPLLNEKVAQILARSIHTGSL